MLASSQTAMFGICPALLPAGTTAAARAPEASANAKQSRYRLRLMILSGSGRLRPDYLA